MSLYPETPESQPEFEQRLRERIAAAGGLSFADFMAACLYDPDCGYYTRPHQRIGREGDFFTSSSVHPLFGRLIARQVRQMAELLGDGSFTLVEMGPGEGHLALDLLDALEQETPELYRRLSLCLVEVSPDGRARQRTLLARHVSAGRIRWARLAELERIEGCLLSNELVDAFPVHLVEQRDGRLQEVFVTLRDGAFAEELRAPSTPRLEAYLAELGVTLPEGNRAEINLAAVDWMGEVARRLARGFVLTIDYGYSAAELYAPWRRQGTLLCYRRHATAENPLLSPGCQDITSHVDFTTLERVGTAAGLQTLWSGPQYRFLMALGFLEELMALQAREADPRRAQELRLTLKRLILPDGGMGEIFKVLVQGKGVGRPELLCQRRIGAIPMPAAGLL